VDPYETEERVSDLEDDFIKVCQDIDDMIPGNKEKAEHYPGNYSEHGGLENLEACDADMPPSDGKLIPYCEQDDTCPQTQNAIARSKKWYASCFGRCD